MSPEVVVRRFGFCLFIIIGCRQLLGGDLTLLEYQGIETGLKDTSFYEFSFQLKEDGSLLHLNLHGYLDQGRFNIWFAGGGYEVIGNYDFEGQFEMENELFGPLNNKEPIQVRVSTNHADGEWQMVFSEISKQRNVMTMFLSGILMVIVSLLFIIGWKRISQSPFRWWLVGAGLWIVGVALKFGCAFLLNSPTLEFLKSTFGQIGYLSIGSFYIGLLTGVFEIGITLVFALFIKTMFENGKRAVMIGVGAGTFEALLLGFAPIGNAILALSGNPVGNTVLSQISQLAMTTPLLWLIGSVERTLAILCHISSRTLVLYAVARKRYIYFWAGFLIMTAIDTIAGYFHLAGLLNRVSLWWVELSILPFAIISIPIIRWCVRNWATGNS